MVTRNEILDFLIENKSNLFSELNISKLALFGSYAKNTAIDSSDIDIRIEFKSNTSNIFEKKSFLKLYIQNRFKKPVDICTEKYIKPYFKKQILNDAIYI